MNRLAFALLTCVVFLIPSEGIAKLPALDALSAVVGSVTRTVGMLAFAGGITAVLLGGKVRRPSVPLAIAAVFVAWASATIFWTIDPVVTIPRVQTFFQLALFMWLLWELADSRDRQRALLQAYVLGAYISAAATLTSFAGGAALEAGRYTSFGADPNDLGSTLALGLPMAWYLSLTATRPTLRWVNRLYLPVALLSVLLTGSRGALFSTSAGLLIIPWSLTRLKLKAHTTIATLAITIMLVFAASSLVPDATWKRYAGLQSQLEKGDYTGRGRIWRAGLQVFREHPIAGAGAGTITVAILPILDRKTSAHNGFIAVLVEQGVVGVAIFTALLVAVGLSPWSLPFPERQLGVVLFFTLVVALLPVNWDYVKQTWFVLGFVPVLSATLPSSVRSRGQARDRGHPLVPGAPPNGEPEPVSLGWRGGPTAQRPARPTQPRVAGVSPAGELHKRPNRQTT